MAESIIFLTGKTLSPENPVSIAPGTAAASLTAAEANSKHRIWALLAAASPANLPHNWYRGNVYIDNTRSSVDAVVSQNSTTLYTVPAGSRYEEWELMGLIGTEPFTVTLAGTTATACIVGERSFI